MVSDASDLDRPNEAVIPQDVEGFYRAVEPHIPKMTRIAARLGGQSERDDIVQAALLNAWRDRRQFDPHRGSLSAWLMAITAHEARRVVRRLARITQPTDQLAERGSAEILDLKAGIRRLSSRQRLAIDCYYLAGLSVAETAAVMRCSPGTVKSTLADARARLRTSLRQTGVRT